jgi:hypothetical protein
VRACGCRGRWDDSPQERPRFNFTTEQRYQLSLQQANTGGPGYLSLALVREGGAASWSSLQGEWQRVRLRRVWAGERHTLSFGSMLAGTFVLEFGFSDVEGYPRITHTHNISLSAAPSTVQWETWRAGVSVSVSQAGARRRTTLPLHACPRCRATPGRAPSACMHSVLVRAATHNRAAALMSLRTTASVMPWCCTHLSLPSVRQSPICHVPGSSAC